MASREIISEKKIVSVCKKKDFKKCVCVQAHVHAYIHAFALDRLNLHLSKTVSCKSSYVQDYVLKKIKSPL